MYARRSVVAVFYHNRDNTLAGSGKYTHNAYNRSNKVVNIMKAQ